MPTPRRRASGRHAIKAICLLIACALVTSVAAGQEGRGDGVGKASKRSRLVTVRGHAEGLYPGGSVPLVLRIRNRSARPLVVTRVTVIPSGPQAACAPSNLSTRAPKHRRLRVEPHGRRRTKVLLTMSTQAPDSCQGARIPLRFRVRARRG